MGYGEEYASSGAFAIYKLAQELSMVVNFHCSNLQTIRTVCEEFPDLPFILAHPSAGKDPFLKRLELVASFPNLYLDYSGSGIMRWGMIRHCIDTAGADKFLFGTDFPVCNPAMYVGCMLSENLSAEEQRLILSGNFRRLVGM